MRVADIVKNVLTEGALGIVLEGVFLAVGWKFVNFAVNYVERLCRFKRVITESVVFRWQINWLK